MEFIIKTLRTLFFSLDKVIYGLIDDVYGLLLQLTRTSVFSEESIHQFAERIYALVGIFMLFKVTVSLVNYVLNPDDFTDKEKGLGSIVKHVILSLVMVVLVPYIFNEAFELQSIILEENTIMNLIFGSPSERQLNISNSSYTESAGQKIQFTIMYAFAQPNYDDFFNDSKYDLADCRHTYIEDKEGNYTFRKTPVFDNVASEDSNFIYALNESCWGVYDPNTDTYIENGENGQLLAAFKSIDSGDVVYQNYAQGVAQQSFNMFFRQDVILAKEEDGSRYFVDYKMGISTAVGVGTLYLFLMFCIDIAIRSVKLGFLQMIAPIPILSYCDPKSGKDGMFKKWTTMCVKTYLDLFIRLFALYFGIYVITLIGRFRDVATGEVVSGWLVSIFMIIGILIFVKKLPDILKESLGLDGGTFKDFKLNPLKRIEEDALGGKAIAGVGKKAVGVVGGVGAGALAMGAGLVTGQGIHRSTLGKAIAGGFKGDKFGKNFANSYGAGRERHKQLQEMHADGVSRGDVFREKAYNAFHGQSRADQVKGVSEGLKAIQDQYKSYEQTAAGVDAIAKEFDKRRKAAEAAGDYAETKKWSTAFDERLKQIAANHGTVIAEMDNRFDISTTVDANGEFTSTAAADIATNTRRTDDNAALKNIADNMDSLAAAMNKQGKNIEGYQAISANTATNIKNVKNQAQGSQQSIDTNATNQGYTDRNKYAGQSKK